MIYTTPPLECFFTLTNPIYRECVHCDLKGTNRMWMPCHHGLYKKMISFTPFCITIKTTRRWRIIGVKEPVTARGETSHLSFHNFPPLPTEGLGAKEGPQGPQAEEEWMKRSCCFQFCQLPGLASSGTTPWRRRGQCWTLPLGGTWQWMLSVSQRDCSHLNCT